MTEDEGRQAIALGATLFVWLFVYYGVARLEVGRERSRSLTRAYLDRTGDRRLRFWPDLFRELLGHAFGRPLSLRSGLLFALATALGLSACLLVWYAAEPSEPERIAVFFLHFHANRHRDVAVLAFGVFPLASCLIAGVASGWLGHRMLETDRLRTVLSTYLGLGLWSAAVVIVYVTVAYLLYVLMLAAHGYSLDLVVTIRRLVGLTRLVFDTYAGWRLQSGGLAAPVGVVLYPALFLPLWVVTGTIALAIVRKAHAVDLVSPEPNLIAAVSWATMVPAVAIAVGFVFLA